MQRLAIHSGEEATWKRDIGGCVALMLMLLSVNCSSPAASNEFAPTATRNGTHSAFKSQALVAVQPAEIQVSTPTAVHSQAFATIQPVEIQLYTPAAVQTTTPTAATSRPTVTAQSTEDPRHIYYVATTGKDDNPGTLNQPFRTIMHGVSLLRPGDTLYIQSGTYTEGLHLIPSGESWDKPVTIAAYPGDTVIINGEYEGYLLYIRSRHHIVVDGIVFDGVNTTKSAIDIGANTHHITIQNSEVRNAAWCGILVKTESNELVNLTVHHSGTSGRGHGIYIKGDNNVIDGCEVYDSAGWGIHVYDNEDDNANLNTVHNCLIHNNGQSAYYEDQPAGIGLYLGTGNVAYNNELWNNHRGIIVDYDAVNSKIYNNTIYDNQVIGVYVGSGNARYGPGVGTIVQNNIVYQNGTSQIVDAGVGTILDHNLIGIDPLFTNAAEYDFRLQTGSPAIDAGIAVNQVASDRAGTDRPQGTGYDIGAFEFRVPAQ